MPKLVLASGSPRRSEILDSVKWPFAREVADIDESHLKGEAPEMYVERLAREKAETVALDNSDAVVLGADTTVVIDGQILGKPTDFEDAIRMLSMLAGSWHEVLTGVAIVAMGETSSAVERTRVKFADMSTDEVSFLAQRGDPLDKAGAYAVQAEAALFIERIEGDYWNVVGLPIRLVYELLRKNPACAGL
ncbi:MAG: nucleoside triphosphate pyrophosphatase [Pyrinomonadaceae bacterium]